MCSMKTMIKMIVGIGMLLIVAYVVFPQFQALIASMAPILLALACPLAMVFMMAGMGGKDNQGKEKMLDRDQK